MKNERLIITSVAAFFGVALLSVGATPLVQHAGATNPTNEGFTASVTPGAAVGPVMNDFPAWGIQGGGPQVVTYRKNFTSEDLAHLAMADWSLSVRLQIAQSIGSIGSNVSLFTESQSFMLFFGTDASGDPYVRFGLNSLGPVYVLSGGGAGYHDYQLFYDAVSQTADLFVDGVERLSNLAPAGQLLPPRLEWGIGQGGMATANWNLISLEIIPEPSSLALLCCAGILLRAGLWRTATKHRTN